ncbi:hypothetical protein J2X36_003027 [Methylobacterium sp. BE186]|uniref:hypothetical protein n=1 Tax=Methylobacterium sp. BE186 TaxID=2817715 RepID=UPI002861C619|nr:hypothetical protein [Methylobacterium sp. BE186]MDR7038268.1 hypothetical protein [Methylobacterium sp. BE186]
MRKFNNLRFITKICIPVSIMIVIAVSLVTYARSQMTGLASDMRTIVDVEAARLESVLKVGLNINEAAVQIRNMIVDERRGEIDK